MTSSSVGGLPGGPPPPEVGETMIDNIPSHHIHCSESFSKSWRDKRPPAHGIAEYTRACHCAFIIVSRMSEGHGPPSRMVRLPAIVENVNEPSDVAVRSVNVLATSQNVV